MELRTTRPPIHPRLTPRSATGFVVARPEWAHDGDVRGLLKVSNAASLLLIVMVVRLAAIEPRLGPPKR
jgi:hypothetical protein